MDFYCRGTSKLIGPRLYFLTVEVNGWRQSFLASTGSCHQAAYLAQQLALCIARRLGLRHVVIRNTNRHVVHQLRGEWRARRPAMRRGRDACRRLAAGLNVQYQVA